MPCVVSGMGVATGWTGVDISTELVPKVVPETGANSIEFLRRRGLRPLVAFGALLASLQSIRRMKRI